MTVYVLPPCRRRLDPLTPESTLARTRCESGEPRAPRDAGVVDQIHMLSRPKPVDEID